MKTAKKILAIAVCLLMVLGITTTAFAAEHSHTITVENHIKGYTYNAYQIFDGDLDSKGVLSNIEWGSGVNGTALLTELKTLPAYAACTDADSVAVILSACHAMDDPAAIAFAEVAAKHVTGTSKTSEWDEAKQDYKIKNLEDGYYLVINTSVPEGGENTLYSRYILEVVRDIKVVHKGDFPDVVKKIVEGENRVDVNEAGIGKPVYYEIVGTLPSNLADFETYYYAFDDTMSKGLTFGNDVKVTVNGVDVTEYFYTETSPYTGTGKYEGGTKLYVGIQDLLALELLDTPDVGDITPNTQVVLTYSATVNEDAIIAVAGNPNKVRLEYDNNPNTEGIPTFPPPNTKPEPEEPAGVTPDDEVESYVTELKLFKVDGTGKALTGAEFTLEGTSIQTILITREEFKPVDASTPAEETKYWKLKDGTYTTTAPVTVDDPATEDIDERTDAYYESLTDLYFLDTVVETQDITTEYKVKSFVGGDGYVTFTGLGAGDYTLTETVTPAGFNTIEPIDFKVTFDPKTKAFNETLSSYVWVETDNTLAATIINVAGSTLPSTGGIGTTIFYIVGGVLFAGAAILLITRKRMTK